MTTEKEQVTASLRKAVAAINEQGLQAPPNFTLRRHLDVLVGVGLIPAEVASRYARIHDEAGFSKSKVAPDEIDSACLDLVSALRRRIEKHPDAVNRARKKMDRLAPEPTDQRSAFPQASPEQPSRSTDAHHTPVASLLEVQTSAPVSPDIQYGADIVSVGPLEVRANRRQRFFALWALVAVGAMAAVAAGYLAHDQISWGLHVLTSHVLDLPFELGSSSGHLDEARRLAGANPASVGHWRRYADRAERQGEHAELVVALRHLVSLQPGSAQAKNELAWLMCTSGEASIRDPVHALELAEKAYAMNKSPAITDTLAEAAFQNGDTRRAVALAEDALARARGDKGHYQRQLEKFRSAAAEGIQADIE